MDNFTLIRPKRTLLDQLITKRFIRKYRNPVFWTLKRRLTHQKALVPYIMKFAGETNPLYHRRTAPWRIVQLLEGRKNGDLTSHLLGTSDYVSQQMANRWRRKKNKGMRNTRRPDKRIFNIVKDINKINY